MLAVIFLFLKILVFCATLLPSITNALPLELKTQAKMHADSPKNSPNSTIGKYILDKMAKVPLVRNCSCAVWWSIFFKTIRLQIASFISLDAPHSFHTRLNKVGKLNKSINPDLIFVIQCTSSTLACKRVFAALLQ